MPASRSSQHAATRTLLLATDLQHSVHAELDRTGPNSFAHTLYGEQSSRLAAGSYLGFTGQLRERPTGWYHLGKGHRVYDPVLRRFHRPDALCPFGKGGINAYAYCEGDPLNFRDPTGKSVVLAQQILSATLQGTAAAALLVATPPATKIGKIGLQTGGLGITAGFTGAMLGIFEVPAAPFVVAAGTGFLILGSFVRFAGPLMAAYESGVLGTTVVTNLKGIVGWSDSAKVDAPGVQLAEVVIEKKPGPIIPDENGNIAELNRPSVADIRHI
ncbi:RHS repeat-associated core domain-containing protein [Pseudomonas sp. SDO55104_S430]